MSRPIVDRPALLAILLLESVSTCPAGDAGLRPESVAGPRLVVEEQLALFERWGETPAAAEEAFALASADNRERLGSVERFRELLETTTYRPLIDNRGWLCGEAVAVEDGRVTLVTTIDRSGRLALFRYFLRPDPRRPAPGWAIDAVVRVTLEPGRTP